MNIKSSVVTIGGPDSLEELDSYFKARTKGNLAMAFVEIESLVNALKAEQLDELRELAEFGLSSTEQLSDLVKRHALARRILRLKLLTRWGSFLTDRVLEGLGRDVNDYMIPTEDSPP